MLSYMPPDERIPFFWFEDHETGIDAEQSKDLGYPVPKFTTFIYVVPHMHKGDPLDFVAAEWIPRKKQETMMGRYPAGWADEFAHGLKCYKEGKEIPRSGIPLRTYVRIAKDRREFLANKFPTIEDLAAVPDSNLDAIGLDGRVLRDLARAEVQSRKDLSPLVEELAEAKSTIAALTERLDALESKKKRQLST